MPPTLHRRPLSPYCCKALTAVCGLLALAACSQNDQYTESKPAQARHAAEAGADLPEGLYRLDRAHASILFRVDHLGFSMYTARFTKFDADLRLDPRHPGEAEIEASVEAASLETDFPNPEMLDFNAMLRGSDWLDAAAHPEITFRSTGVEITGPDTARVTGDFTLRGVTKPLTLNVRFNGGYRGLPQYDPQARIGFSATASLKRTDFGMNVGVRTADNPLGVGDDVEVIVEAEFTGPPLSTEG